MGIKPKASTAQHVLQPFVIFPQPPLHFVLGPPMQCTEDSGASPCITQYQMVQCLGSVMWLILLGMTTDRGNQSQFCGAQELPHYTWWCAGDHVVLGTELQIPVLWAMSPPSPPVCLLYLIVLIYSFFVWGHTQWSKQLTSGSVLRTNYGETIGSSEDQTRSSNVQGKPWIFIWTWANFLK